MRPMEEGRGPFRELYDMYRTCKEDIRPMEEGRGPVRELYGIYRSFK